MIKGMYSAVSAMIMNAARQQVLAHNVANIETPGFKQVLTLAEDWLQTPVLYSPGNLLQNRHVQNIGLLGLGTELGAQTTDFTQGGLQVTQNPLDFAIEGEGFFRVRTPQGDRYTRDGRFIRDAQNNLVTVDGNFVLSEGGQPIRLPDGQVAITPNGALMVNGAQVARFGLARFEDAQAELERSEGNLYSGPAQPTGQGEVRVAQGMLEMSNANPTQLMTQLVEVGRAYEAALKMVQNQDELLGKTIASLGRIG
ncbi:MAG: flagellar hook-basal body protein [Chloroflexota bacterium]